MQINKENLTVIIVTIKSQKVIDTCLKSIDPDIKKIIVENSSDEAFKKDILKKYKNVECYLTGENLGMGKGNNFGINKSKTQYVMVLNPDTILQNNTLDEIFKISINLDFAILSPISENKDYPNFKMKESNFEQDGLFEVERVDGYAMILDKSKFDNNYFDENIFMYLENDDLCLRMKKKGEKIYIYDKSTISHFGGKAVDPKYENEIEYSRNWHWSWSKFYFRKKHYGFTLAFFLSIPAIIKSYFKCCFFFLILNRAKSKLYFQRTSGLISSILNKKSWYRPRLD